MTGRLAQHAFNQTLSHISLLLHMQVAFPAFRDGGARGASLVAYFEDARVTGWLALHGEEADSPFAAAAAWGRGLRSRIASLVPVTRVVNPKP